jgi:hypothetical protein
MHVFRPHQRPRRQRCSLIIQVLKFYLLILSAAIWIPNGFLCELGGLLERICERVGLPAEGREHLFFMAREDGSSAFAYTYPIANASLSDHPQDSLINHLISCGFFLDFGLRFLINTLSNRLIYQRRDFYERNY